MAADDDRLAPRRDRLAVGTIAWFVIRYPYARRARRAATVRVDGWSRERILLGVATVGLFVVPVVYLATGWPRALNYDLNYAAVAIGVLVYVASLWLFRRSHKDLGRQWSASLEIREKHQIVRAGVYRLIRHPMYASFWLWALAQAFLLPNAVAALSGLVAVASCSSPARLRGTDAARGFRRRLSCLYARDQAHHPGIY